MCKVLKIFFSCGLNVVIDMAKEEADEQISSIYKSQSQWITLNANNNSTTYNKSLIAMMESK